MSRINVVTPEQANSEQSDLYAAIQGQLGVVPNFLKVFAHSPDALRAFLGLHTIANAGQLDPLIRESIALAVAEQNECQYCVSAHTAIGRKVGLSSEEIAANRAGDSTDSTAAEAVKFAQALVRNNGEISHSEFLAVRNAGYTDAQIVEIITHVGMNLLTNILGKASEVDIDFPKIELKPAA